MQLLHKLYYNAKTGYISASKLYKKAREIDPQITRKQVTEWYKSQPDIQQYTNQRYKYPEHQITQMNGKLILCLSMFNEIEHNEKIATKITDEFTPSTAVRYKLTSTKFQKEGARWSPTVYEYIGLDGLRAHIRSKNGHVKYVPINDLQRVSNVQPRNVHGVSLAALHEAKQIISHKKTRNGIRYEVQWANDGSITWEPQKRFRIYNKDQPSHLERQYWATNN